MFFLSYSFSYNNDYLQSDRYEINQHYQQQQLQLSSILPPPPNNGAQDIKAGKFFFLFYTICFTTNNLLLLDYVRLIWAHRFDHHYHFHHYLYRRWPRGLSMFFLSYSFSYTNDCLQLERYTINQHYEQQHSSILPPPPSNDDQQQQEHSTVTLTGTKYNSIWLTPTGGEKTRSMCFPPATFRCHWHITIKLHLGVSTSPLPAPSHFVTLGDGDGPCDRDSIDMLQITNYNSIIQLSAFFILTF